MGVKTAPRPTAASLVDPESPIADAVRVSRRYGRSVDVGRDLTDPRALEGYVVTPTVRDAMERILKGLREGSTHRAFRITGPYGAGKSAFGLLLARLASERLRPGAGGQATALLAEAGVDVRKDLPTYLPAVATGRRTSLQSAVLEAIATAASDRGPGRSCAPVERKAAELLGRRRCGELDDDAILALIDDFARRGTRRPGEKGAVLLIVDEMGRFLEHAALNRHADDPSFVQRLAEKAAGAEPTLALVALLHHRFADYAAGLGRWAEAEWMRAAQRYEEVTFHGSLEQTLFLAARALQAEHGVDAIVGDRARSLYVEAAARSIFLSSAKEVSDLSPRLFPLHPAAIACLGRLVSRFGQHERSVFGFLTSDEPSGLQRFAAVVKLGANRWYDPADLFDYLRHQELGSSAAGEAARRWSLARDAVSQIGDMSSEDARVLKCIALLAVLEPVPGLKSDVGTIAWALDLPPEGVAQATGRLRKAGLVHHRPQRDDHGLWSSTSVDLDAWLDEARVRVAGATRIDPASLADAERPMLAHRHYHRTGHLRAFATSHLGTDGRLPPRRPEFDGSIVVVAIHPDETAATVGERVAALAAVAGPMTLFCLRRLSPVDLRTAHEIALWRWIEANCPELRVDDLARREARERVASASARLAGVLRPLGGMERERGESWFVGGSERRIATRAELSSTLSDLCDATFGDAPVLRNELVNRARLSSAAAAARMRLLTLMVQEGHRERLGIAGTPPEAAIYLSLLSASGMHRDMGGGRFGFAPPEPDVRNWLPCWRRVEAMLEGNATASVPTLLEALERAPYGLRAGPALVLVAAVMLHHGRDVALIERNTFQPEITNAHLMRLAKNPGHFGLRHLGHGDGRRDVLGLLAAEGTPWRDDRPEPTVKGVVEAIYRWWAGLPGFALRTSRISPMAREVRLALAKGREPIALVFEALPAACGLALTEEGDVLDGRRFVETLNVALTELSDATPVVRRSALEAVFDAFGTGSVEDTRSWLETSYGRHRLQVGDQRMRTFIDRATNHEGGAERWLDGLSGHLCGRRLDAWDDGTADVFAFEIRAMAQRLARWLATVKAAGFEATGITAVHFTGTDGRERTAMMRPGPLGREASGRLERAKEALGSGPEAAVILAHLVADRVSEEETIDG